MWLSSVRSFSQIWLRTGYESRGKKRKRNPESFHFLGYLLELIIIIWRFGFGFEFVFPSKSGESGPIFPWKILSIDQNDVFRVEIWRNFFF
jgi:hypothetical protein